MVKLKNISFSSYKKFEDKGVVEIRPITILIGKNSSGKSSISKLFPMFEKALCASSLSPFSFENDGVALGASFSDISHNGNNIGLSFGLEYEDGFGLNIEFISKMGNYDYWIKRYQVSFAGMHSILEQKKDQSAYFDINSNKEYSSYGFRGFVNEEFLKANGINSVRPYRLHTDYIGPFRVFPKRVYCQRISSLSNKVGYDGSWAYDNLNLSKELLSVVSGWYSSKFGCELTLKQLDNGVFSVNVRNKNSGHETNIADEGQGMSQILPIVTRCNMVDEKDTVIAVEQPELHLHPAAHEAVAELFVETSKKNNHRYVIETHSKNLLLEIRNLVADKTNPFTKDDVIIYYVNECGDNAVLDEIGIDENGNVSDWPEEVFNESFELMKKLRKNAE